MPKINNKTKVTYNYDTKSVLLLKEAYERDINLFYKLFQEAPRNWTFTVITVEGRKELLVNIPPKK